PGGAATGALLRPAPRRDDPRRVDNPHGPPIEDSPSIQSSRVRNNELLGSQTYPVSNTPALRLGDPAKSQSGKLARTRRPLVGEESKYRRAPVPLPDRGGHV